MFEITSHPAAKTALENAHALRGAALREAWARVAAWIRGDRKSAGAFLHPAE